MDERTRDMTNALYLLITGSLPVPEYPGVMMADLIETHDACVRAEAKAEALREAAPDYDHYWQIVLHWAKDDGQAIKRLSVLQMRTLCERLESITRHAILADQAPEAEKVEGPQVKESGGANTLQDVIDLLEIARDAKSGISFDWVEAGILLRACHAEVERRIQEGK